MLPVMLVGMLLLVALIGVIVLARPDALAQAERRRINRRRRVNRPLGQRDFAADRLQRFERRLPRETDRRRRRCRPASSRRRE